MTVQVEYTATLASAVGVAEEMVHTESDDPISVDSLVKALVTRHGEPLLGRLVDGNGRLLPSVLVSVNDAQVEEGQMIHSNDRVLLVSAVGGG